MDKNEMGIFGDDSLDLNYDSFDVPMEEPQEEDENTETLGEDENPEVVSENEGSEDEGDDNPSEEGGDTSSPDTKLYSSLATLLTEEGLLPSLEDPTKITSPDALAEAFIQERNKQAELLLEEYIRNIDVTKVAQSRATLQELENLDADALRENLELAKEIIFRDYINQGLTEDKAKRYLKKSIDLGEDVLLEDALESLESIKQHETNVLEREREQYQKEQEKLMEEQKKIVETVKSKIETSKELLEGLPLTKAVREKTFKSMNEVVSKNPQTGELENELMKVRRENPIDFDIKLHYLFTITNGFKDIKNIQSKTRSKVTSDLEKAIRQTKHFDNNTPIWAQETDSYSSNINGELNI